MRPVPFVTGTGVGVMLTNGTPLGPPFGCPFRPGPFGLGRGRGRFLPAPGPGPLPIFIGPFMGPFIGPFIGPFNGPLGPFPTASGTPCFLLK
jgi:hypothetical protein